MSCEMSATLTLTRIETSLDALLDAAAVTGGRITWGRARLMRRHWVAVEFPGGYIKRRRARTRAEAAHHLFHDLYSAG